MTITRGDGEDGAQWVQRLSESGGSITVDQSTVYNGGIASCS